MKQIFIPAPNASGVHIKLNRLFSFESSGYRIFIVIGARGYGKTYSTKRTCAKDKIFQNEDMAIVRDSESACEEICKDNGIKFWGDVFGKDKGLQKHSYKIENSTILIDNKIAGNVIPLSTYHKFKGNYYNIRNFLFDEFIEEKQQVYRGNRARQFANTVETICRTNPRARIILTGNALDLGNDILEILGLNIKNEQFGYYLIPEKKVVCYYAPNSPEFNEAKNESLSGLITKGTFLDDNMNNNSFDNENKLIFEKRKPCSLFGIYYSLENVPVRIYQAKDDSEFYVCKDRNEQSYSYMRFVFDIGQVNNNRKFADKKVKDYLHKQFVNNKMKFESNFIYGVFLSILNGTKKK